MGLMTGIICEDIEKLTKGGYQIREDSKTQLLKENEVVAEITIDDKALLTIEVEGEVQRGLKWIKIITPFVEEKVILMEMEDEKGESHFCELPTKEMQPIFW